MPEIFIDNVRFEYEGQGKVLQFMLDHNIDLPYFCYHPELSIPANCRQCLVEAGLPVFNREKNAYDLDDKGERIIRFFPKLMTACSMDLQDGLVVKTHVTSDLVKRAQKDTLEFILINHPLDCPICDQAGECPLQIQTYKYGPEGSRFEFKKVHKPKRIQLGPRVVLDAERCINCTRCVRFTEEISKSNQLTIISRGDKNYPTTAEGRTFDDPYSLNTVDICPVGALTSSDFRFKARVWEMNQTPSIDITNGKGSNTILWTRDNLVLRITPRQNDAVNSHWMPDKGREAYRLFNENRVSKPDIKLDGTNKAKTSWNNALETFAERVALNEDRKVLFIGSPYASVEDNYVVHKLLTQTSKADTLYVPHVVKGAGDGFLITDDQAPNTAGCELLGFKKSSEKDLVEKISSKKYNVVVVLGDDLVERTGLSQADFDGIFVIAFASNYTKTTEWADLVIPMTCAAEHAASYVNVDGRIQRTVAAKETVYTDRRLNLEMGTGRLAKFGTKFDNWMNDQNRVDTMPAWEFSMKVAERLGMDYTYYSSREIMEEIAAANKAFEGVSYDRMDDEQGIQLTKVDNQTLETEHV